MSHICLCTESDVKRITVCREMIYRLFWMGMFQFANCEKIAEGNYSNLVKTYIDPLVNWQFAIENSHLYLIYPLKIVIFHTYLSLPEDNQHQNVKNPLESTIDRGFPAEFLWNKTTWRITTISKTQLPWWQSPRCVNYPGQASPGLTPPKKNIANWNSFGIWYIYEIERILIFDWHIFPSNIPKNPNWTKWISSKCIQVPNHQPVMPPNIIPWPNSSTHPW